jgi:hypothetical protein
MFGRPIVFSRIRAAPPSPEEPSNYNEHLDMLMAQAPEAQEGEEEEDQGHFEPCPLPSRKHEMKRFGKRKRDEICWLCAYMDEHKTTVPSDDAHLLIEFSKGNNQTATVSLKE